MSLLGWKLTTADDVDAANPIESDLMIVGNRFARLPDRASSIAQAVLVALRWWKREWSFDRSKGMPYFDEVLGKSPTVATVRAMLVRELKKIDGVLEVTAATITIDPRSGLCSASDVEVNTDVGTLAIGGA